MAQLRLIALVACVACTAACRSSEAGPTSGLTPPAGWRALPDVAGAAREAGLAAKATIDGVEAWGDTARGCYGVWLAMSSDAGAPDVLADKLLSSLTSAPTLAGITVTDIVKPPKAVDSGMLSLSFSRAPYSGKLRAQIGKTGAYAVLACLWNGREPAACEAACTVLLGGMK